MILVTVLYILVCVILVVIILLQHSKGAGMGILGGSSDTILGSAAGNILTKTTSFLAFLFILGALVMSVLSSGGRSKIESETGTPPSEGTAPPPAELRPEEIEPLPRIENTDREQGEQAQSN